MAGIVCVLGVFMSAKLASGWLESELSQAADVESVFCFMIILKETHFVLLYFN